MKTRITIAAILVLTVAEWMIIGLVVYMFFVVTMDCKVKMMKSAKSSENTSPYMRVRLRRDLTPAGMKRYKANFPMWVEILHEGRWRRIKRCRNENEAIDALVMIAGKLRGENSLK